MSKKEIEDVQSYFLCRHFDCIHTSRANGNCKGGFIFCDYIGSTGEKRPCKPTPKCKCYKTGKKPRKNFTFGKGARMKRYVLRDNK